MATNFASVPVLKEAGETNKDVLEAWGAQVAEDESQGE